MRRWAEFVLNHRRWVVLSWVVVVVGGGVASGPVFERLTFDWSKVPSVRVLDEAQ
jgi:RND superfamily putative drug exporter